jgi:hypothetical protein
MGNIFNQDFQEFLLALNEKKSTMSWWEWTIISLRLCAFARKKIRRGELAK